MHATAPGNLRAAPKNYGAHWQRGLGITTGSGQRDGLERGGLLLEPERELGAGQDGSLSVSGQVWWDRAVSDDGETPVIEGDELWQ